MFFNFVKRLEVFVRRCKMRFLFIIMGEWHVLNMFVLQAVDMVLNNSAGQQNCVFKKKINK